VIVAVTPGLATAGEAPPDGSAWTIDGETYTQNPVGLLDDCDLAMVQLWRLAHPSPGRIGGMAGGVIPVAGHLPDAGGAGDQAAAMMDAFRLMTAAEAEATAARER
jgi:hypothetical protein